jgi:hypothetical protein
MEDPECVRCSARVSLPTGVLTFGRFGCRPPRPQTASRLPHPHEGSDGPG